MMRNENSSSSVVGPTPPGTSTAGPESLSRAGRSSGRPGRDAREEAGGSEPEAGAAGRPPTSPSGPLIAMDESWALSRLSVFKLLYGGYASAIHKAKCLKTGQVVILKQYHKEKLTALTRYQVTREIEIHSRSRHPNIISLYGSFEDDDHIYMVQEYASKGDVFSHIGKLPDYQMDEDALVLYVLRPLLEGLVCLHSQGIIHRDIKPENLLLTADMTLKLADFGLSIDTNKERPVTRAGTLDYMAPEVVVCPGKRHPQDNKDNLQLKGDTAIDVWAVGVLAYELLTGKAPFDSGCSKKTSLRILRGQLSRSTMLSDASWDFIQLCLRGDAADRPSCQRLLFHPFISRRGSSINGATVRSRHVQAPPMLPSMAGVRPPMFDVSDGPRLADEELHPPPSSVHTSKPIEPPTPEAQRQCQRPKASPVASSPSRSPAKSPGKTSPTQQFKVMGSRQAAGARPGQSALLRQQSEGAAASAQPELLLGELLPLARSISLNSGKRNTAISNLSILPHLPEAEQMCGLGTSGTGWRPPCSPSKDRLQAGGQDWPEHYVNLGDGASQRAARVPATRPPNVYPPGKGLPPL